MLVDYYALGLTDFSGVADTLIDRDKRGDSERRQSHDHAKCENGFSSRARLYGCAGCPLSYLGSACEARSAGEHIEEDRRLEEERKRKAQAPGRLAATIERLRVQQSLRALRQSGYFVKHVNKSI